ncbi:MAG: glycosyltransferase family 2 protein [Flavobacterium sp.]
MISGLIITYNEEKHIKSVLENIDFVDEIIIVDSYSTDKTIEIINSFPNVKLFQRKFDDFTSQRNFALSLASNDWILFIDADERVPIELKNEIIETASQQNDVSAYYFYRKFMYQNKPLHFSGWQTDKNFRLFKKSKCSYINERLVHETLKVEGKTGILTNKLIHYSFDEYQKYKNKMISYGKLRAKELFLKGKKYNLFIYIFKPLYKFLYDYIIRLGFLDGKKGIVICYLNALSVYSRYPELKRLYLKNKTH